MSHRVLSYSSPLTAGTRQNVTWSCAINPTSRSRRYIHTKRGAATMAASVMVDVPSIPPIFDIFDVPARMINEAGSSKSPSSLLRSALSSSSRKTQRGSSAGAVAGANSPSSSTSTSTVLYTQIKPLLFDGPARPRHRLVVTSRHRKASTVHASTVAYVPPEPEVFDGPSRPRRYAPVAYPKKKSMSTPTQGVFLAVITSLLGISTYEVLNHDVQIDIGRRSVLTRRLS